MSRSALKYLKWLLFDRWVCKHSSVEWEFKDAGISKVKWCNNCGACLEIL